MINDTRESLSSACIGLYIALLAVASIVISIPIALITILILGSMDLARTVIK